MPVLLRRLLSQLGRPEIQVARPFRVSRLEMVRPGEIERAIVQGIRDRRGVAAVLVILTLMMRTLWASKLPSWNGAGTASPLPCAVVAACREFEAWFLGSKGLATRGLRDPAGRERALWSGGDPGCQGAPDEQTWPATAGISRWSISPYSRRGWISIWRCGVASLFRGSPRSWRGFSPHRKRWLQLRLKARRRYRSSSPAGTCRTRRRCAAAARRGARACRSATARGVSPGKRTITTGFFRYFRARNICSPPAAGGRPVVGLPLDQHQRRVDLLDVGDRRARREVLRGPPRARPGTRWAGRG